jgi:Cysteine-rich CWC
MEKEFSNAPPLGGWGGKHEIVACERCRSPFECKANSFTKCQCMTVQLNINETQYISEQYDGCLCAACLTVLRDEYRAEILVAGKN